MNCLTVDVEEYFHCEVFAGRVPADTWSSLERRAEPCLERIGAWLEASDNRATFFVLGSTVPPLAPLLRTLVKHGHEIASHGFGHQHLARLSAQSLREDVTAGQRVIEDALGVCVRGYRAPTFSITRATAWALDVILDAGFEYDASIFPIHHDRYGVPDAPRGPFWAISPLGRRILEFPPMTARLGPLRVPLGGGGYLRLLPGGIIRAAVRARHRRDEPVMIYVHPWELDPGQPRLPATPLGQWRHRVNLHTTGGKLQRLLRDFRFDTARAVLARVCEDRVLPEFALDVV